MNVKKRLGQWVLYGLYCCAVCAIGLLLVESILRVLTDRPLGLFDATPLNHSSLYHPNSRIPIKTMQIPYVVKTNRLGFRGPEIKREKAPGTIRIAALGDSITDGYMVDNPDTYPVRLEAFLRDKKLPVEVLNAARGSATIDREYWILRQHVAPLNPDVVVLTFVGNDIYEMGGRSAAAMIAFNPEALDWPRRAALWAGRTATGELFLDQYFSARYAGYRGQDRPEHRSWGPERYDIDSATDYEALLPAAREKVQGYKLHLTNPDAVLQERLNAYLAVLKHMHNWCRARDITLVWAWFPTFVQTYSEAPSEYVYDDLLPRVREAGIPVIDVVPAFRAAPRDVPLYLAPVDYHLTPAGNRVLAEAIGEGLVDNDILDRVDTEVE